MHAVKGIYDAYIFLNKTFGAPNTISNCRSYSRHPLLDACRGNTEEPRELLLS